MDRFAQAFCLAVVLCGLPASPQVIEFESNGLRYQTLSKSGVTVMLATLPSRLRAYAIVQVSVVNGSSKPYNIRPEDFTYVRSSGEPVRGESADVVVQFLAKQASRGDVVSLISTYESALSGIPRRSTNGYEQRRQAALMAGQARIRAATLASAIAMVQTRLRPGESTDGAVFLPTERKPLGPGRYIVKTIDDVFEFNPERER
jgi:hypothetical protein